MPPANNIEQKLLSDYLLDGLVVLDMGIHDEFRPQCAAAGEK
jgi:hypothetical protein